MGLYDREIEQELLAFCQIKPQQLDFTNIKNIYDEMKRNILVEVYIPDVIHQLEDIQNAPSFQKDALINQYIDDLHHKVLLPSDIISYSNTIVAAIAYWMKNVHRIQLKKVSILFIKYTKRRINNTAMHGSNMEMLEYVEIWEERCYALLILTI